MQKKTYSIGGDEGGEGGEEQEGEKGGGRYFHLLVGTTSNCVAEVSFRTDESTNILDLEVETAVQGHAGAIGAVAEVPGADQFFSGGEDQQLALWDSVAHKSVWASVLSAAVNAVSVSSSEDGPGHVAVGLENGAVMVADLETKHLENVYDVEGA